MNALLKGVLFGALLFGGLYANIFAHELGHYFLAAQLGLDPHVHFFDDGSGTGFSFAGQQHYVEYQSPYEHLSRVDFQVALAGPLVNILITVLLIYFYAKIPKRNATLKTALVMLMIPSLLSAIANLIPTPGSDGYTVWAYLGL
jgi:Zn-dependent protease